MTAIGDDEIRAMLRDAIVDATDVHKFGLDALDCGILARSLVETAKEIVRQKRPIRRGPSHKPYIANRLKRINEETRSKASNSRQRWTGPELQIALRRDLTQEQAAEMLGRSFLAVRSVRKKAKRDPRYQRLAGVET